jgi:hypothetical protein
VGVSRSPERPKEIAETLGISTKTAGHHIQHIVDKAGVRTRSAATVCGVRTPPPAGRLGIVRRILVSGNRAARVGGAGDVLATRLAGT